MNTGRHAASEPATGLSHLNATSLRYRRAGRDILADVSLAVAPGQVLGVVGPSGSGKSSLLALLAGLEPPDSGTVTAPRRPDEQPSRQGLVLQGYGLVGVLTAAENVEVPLQVEGNSESRIRAAADQALDAVGLSAVGDHLVEELSGGQQQRVAVARALAGAPDVLYADELTAELDHDWRERVVALSFGVARRGGIVVIATHDPEIAARCDRTITLVDGRVVATAGVER